MASKRVLSPIKARDTLGERRTGAGEEADPGDVRGVAYRAGGVRGLPLGPHRVGDAVKVRPDEVAQHGEDHANAVLQLPGAGAPCF